MHGVVEKPDARASPCRDTALDWNIKIPLDLPHNNQIRITPTTNSLRRLYRPREAHRTSMYAYLARAESVGHSSKLLRGGCACFVERARRTGVYMWGDLRRRPNGPAAVTLSPILAQDDGIERRRRPDKPS